MKRPRRAELLLLLVLTLAPAAVPAQTQEPTIVRLNDVVGDTIDTAERDSFLLFPNTAGFEHAVILALPGPEFFAQVTLASADTTRQVFFRILPRQLERVRFLIDHPDFVAGQQKSDSTAVQVLASFWQSIEGRPLRSIAGEPPETQDVARAPSKETTAAEQQLPLSTHPVRRQQERRDRETRYHENRYHGVLLGTGLGSLAGGYIGSQTGIEYVRTKTLGTYECGGYTFQRTVRIYSVNHPVFWTAACGLTAVGSTVGYMVGNEFDQRASLSPAPPTGGRSWRTCCAIGSAVPGILLGATFVLAAANTRHGKLDPPYEIENDPQNATLLPMVLTGLCIAVELTTIGYHIGRAIDRGNAEKAEAKRREFGR